MNMILHSQEVGEITEYNHRDLLRDSTGKWRQHTTDTSHKAAGDLLSKKGWNTNDKTVYTHPDMPGHAIRIGKGHPASPWHNDTNKHDVAWTHTVSSDGSADKTKMTKTGKGLGSLRQHVEDAESMLKQGRLATCA